MDFRLKRLYEAAYAGDVYSLNELLEEDNLLLDRVVTTTEVNDNPLHIAATLGHAGFTREILRRKPKLPHEFNSQHMSPLHLAAAQGHLEVAEELLQIQVGADLCNLEDKDGYLPVHLAVMKGRHDLFILLVGKCEDSVNKPTSFAETILHLAVKAKHSEIVELLTERGVTQLVLNDKDGNGNTILHLAFSGRQQRVIKHLLSQASIDVNSLNSTGLTPLDVLLVTNQEMGDLYLGEMIRAAGGKTAKELQASENNIVECSSPIDAHNTSQAILPSTPSNQITRTRSNTEEISKNIEKNLIVVATLVATVTFAAALNPPGGSIQMPFIDSDRNNTTWLTKWKQMDTLYPVGSPVYLWHLRKFFMYDYFALFASVSVILLCLPGFIPRGNTMKKILLLILWISIFFMVLAFTSALSILLYEDKNFRTFRWFTLVFNIWIYFFGFASALLFGDVICSLMGKLPGTPSWLSNLCSPKFKQFIRWDKIKRVLLNVFGAAFGILLGFWVSLAIDEMANSSIS